MILLPTLINAQYAETRHIHKGAHDPAGSQTPSNNARGVPQTITTGLIQCLYTATIDEPHLTTDPVRHWCSKVKYGTGNILHGLRG